METNGRAYATDYFTFPANAVGNNLPRNVAIWWVLGYYDMDMVCKWLR